MNIFKTLFGGHKEQADARPERVNSFDALKRDGMGALERHQYDAAVDSLALAIELDASDIECLDALSQAYVGLGELSKAYDQLQQIAEAKPADVAILMRMAELAQMMKNYTAMSDVCEKVLLADNSNAQAYFLYGKACRALGDMTNAQAMLTRAVMLRDDFAAARELLGEVLRESGAADISVSGIIYNKEKAGENTPVNTKCK